ncbi:MAG: Crp/Fnr family transcriptional regulator [Chlamydiae bacterium]|nr:Crp/Fnr family transcriptional regulator [Chlamydiota bacterium]MBI3276977.1 Crp/Fnr family transcriptional regulator [Chlamydiota bacterium]
MKKNLEDYSSFFSNLRPEEVHRLAQVAQEKNYSKGELVFSRGEPGNAVWILKEGRVHLQNVSYDGKVITSCIMIAGDIFCCLPALDGKPYTSDAVVIEPSIVLRIPSDFFRQLARENPRFSNKVMCTFCDRLRDMEGKGCQAFDPAELRMARLLLTLGEKFKGEIPLTRQEMAEIAGLTVETAIRILSQMKKEGIIRSGRKMTKVIAPQKLKERVME